jgi:hypothetical protein
MAIIRRDLRQDVNAVVQGAEQAADWRHYVRRYPWVALGGAVVAGYLAVPKRRPSVSKTAEKAAAATVAKLREADDPLASPRSARSRWGIIGTALGFVSPILIRAAQGYAAQYVENLIAAQTGQHFGAPSGARDSTSTNAGTMGRVAPTPSSGDCRQTPFNQQNQQRRGT